MYRYLKTDFYRMVTSWQFYAGILGIGVLYLFGGYQAAFITDVYISYFYNGWFSTAIMAYAFCSMSFSGCFIEDSEYQFWYLEVQKRNIKQYAWSKTLICFVSGVLTMIFGILLFVFMLHIRVPFYQEHSFIADQRTMDNFGELLYPETILLYFICSAAFCGVLGGIFALLSAFLSLYEKYRLFTICVPVIGFYFLENFLISNLKMPNFLNIWVIYGSGYSLFGNSFWNIVYGLLVAMFFVIVLGFLVERKLKEDICNIHDKAKIYE